MHEESFINFKRPAKFCWIFFSATTLNFMSLELLCGLLVKSAHCDLILTTTVRILKISYIC